MCVVSLFSVWVRTVFEPGFHVSAFVDWGTTSPVGCKLKLQAGDGFRAALVHEAAADDWGTRDDKRELSRNNTGIPQN